MPKSGSIDLSGLGLGGLIQDALIPKERKKQEVAQNALHMLAVLGPHLQGLPEEEREKAYEAFKAGYGTYQPGTIRKLFGAKPEVVVPEKWSFSRPEPPPFMTGKQEAEIGSISEKIGDPSFKGRAMEKMVTGHPLGGKTYEDVQREKAVEEFERVRAEKDPEGILTEEDFIPYLRKSNPRLVPYVEDSLFKKKFAQETLAEKKSAREDAKVGREAETARRSEHDKEWSRLEGEKLDARKQRDAAMHEEAQARLEQIAANQSAVDNRFYKAMNSRQLDEGKKRQLSAMKTMFDGEMKRAQTETTLQMKLYQADPGQPRQFPDTAGLMAKWESAFQQIMTGDGTPSGPENPPGRWPEGVGERRGLHPEVKKQLYQQLIK